MMDRTKLDIKPQTNKKLGLLIVAVGLLTLVNIGISGFLGLANLLGSSSDRNLVQLENGKTIRAKEVSSSYRQPQTIKNFIEQIYTGLYTSDGYLPRLTLDDAVNPQPDPGIEIEGQDGRKVATGTWEASFGLEPKLRQETLAKLAEALPQSVFKQQKSLAIIINHIGEPIPIEGKPGHWKVNLVSTLIAFQDGQQLGKVIPNNKRIYIRAVKPPQYGEFKNPLTEVIAHVRQSGLEIYNARDLTKADLEQSLK